MIRRVNLQHYLLYKWAEHHIKALKTINQRVILTAETQEILSKLFKKESCFGLNIPMEALLEDLQRRIYYLEEIYVGNQPLKKMTI